MAGLSISGESLSGYCPFYHDGGLMTSAFIKDDNVPATKLHCEVLTGVVSAGTPTSAAHTLGAVPTLVIPTCASSGYVATTGIHTSTAVLGIVSNVAGGANFIIYVFE